MTGMARVVFDCNIFVQSLLSASGPAARCLQSAERGRLRLFVSEYVLEEVRDVALRPKIVSRFGITLTGLEAFLAHILAISECLEDVPTEFHYDGDHDDAHYVNLAIAAHASLIVSRDHDLLVLGDSATPEGADFRTRYPGIEIIPPVELLTRLDAK